jgi:hypothetical protein
VDVVNAKHLASQHVRHLVQSVIKLVKTNKNLHKMILCISMPEFLVLSGYMTTGLRQNIME